MARSYSGDPGFLANNPFLDMLAMVEDGLNQADLDEAGPSHGGQPGSQQQRVEMRAGKVKLPEFWPHSPGIWFARAELRFAVGGVTSEIEKFAYAADSLQYETLRLVTDLVTNPPADRPYTALKERLLIAHQLTPIQKAQKVSSEPPLGDRRPSQLLAALLEFCPDGEENTAFFRSAFVHRLPAELQVLLDNAETEDLKSLAQKADRLWVTRAACGQRIAAVEAAYSSETEEEAHCLAVNRAQAAKRGGKGYNKAAGSSKVGYGGGGRNGGEKQGDKRSKLLTICRAHMRYGADAYRCQDPKQCAWAEN